MHLLNMSNIASKDLFPDETGRPRRRTDDDHTQAAESHHRAAFANLPDALSAGAGPGHATYPAGHALIGQLTTECRRGRAGAPAGAQQASRARRFNRVIAGLHFRQDIDVGFDAARKNPSIPAAMPALSRHASCRAQQIALTRSTGEAVGRCDMEIAGSAPYVRVLLECPKDRILIEAAACWRVKVRLIFLPYARPNHQRRLSTRISERLDRDQAAVRQVFLREIWRLRRRQNSSCARVCQSGCAGRYTASR